MSENIVIVENTGIGYEIKVPLSVINNIDNIGEEVKIFTYMNVKEDDVSLFGFLEKDELDVFKMLITVSGIGPKGALGILSTMTTDELRFAIMADDAKSISKAPGIGKKTASKLILELKDKLKIDVSSIDSKVVTNNNVDDKNAIKKETILALEALGYSSQEAYKALNGINITEDAKVEDVLKIALKNMF